MTEPTQPAPGWYHAQGDPMGTQRYWNGTQWTGDPRPVVGQTVAGNVAEPWTRIGAALIDFALFFVIGLVFGASQLDLNSTNVGELDTSIGASMVLSGLVFLYRWLMVAKYGATLGKLALNLRVEAIDHTIPPPNDVAAKRASNSLIGIVSAVIPIAGLATLGIGIVSLVYLFSDSEHRTVMDRFAGTRVVKANQ